MGGRFDENHQPSCSPGDAGQIFEQPQTQHFALLPVVLLHVALADALGQSRAEASQHSHAGTAAAYLHAHTTGVKRRLL